QRGFLLRPQPAARLVRPDRARREPRLLELADARGEGLRRRFCRFGHRLQPKPWPGLRLVTTRLDRIRNRQRSLFGGGPGMAVAEALELDELRQRIRGEVIAGGDEAYEQARRVWNGVIDRSPTVVIRASGNADVIAAIGFAREQGLPVSVRGG